MNRTNIEYLTHTWNPIAMRCTPVSAGCANCWHLAMANRLAANPNISPEARAAYAGGTGPVLIEERLDEPVKRKKPAVIGVQFMGDLFHESITRPMIGDVMSAAYKTPQHVFIFLTKRADAMANTLHGEYFPNNVYLGVSVSGQKTSNIRIPQLLDTNAHHFISYEPALSNIDLTDVRSEDTDWKINALNGEEAFRYDRRRYDRRRGVFPSVDWAIAGSESGHGRRACDLDHLRFVRDQCIAYGVPFFLKQLYIDGQRTSMPELDDRVWDQCPERIAQILREYE